IGRTGKPSANRVIRNIKNGKENRENSESPGSGVFYFTDRFRPPTILRLHPSILAFSPTRISESSNNRQKIEWTKILPFDKIVIEHMFWSSRNCWMREGGRAAASWRIEGLPAGGSTDGFS